MEQEKIQEGERVLREDKERFANAEKNYEEQGKKLAEDIKTSIRKKTDLQSIIDKKTKELYKVENDIKKKDEELIDHKRDKHFLDVIAIQNKLKAFRPMKEVPPPKINARD